MTTQNQSLLNTLSSFHHCLKHCDDDCCNEELTRQYNKVCVLTLHENKKVALLLIKANEDMRKAGRSMIQVSLKNEHIDKN